MRWVSNLTYTVVGGILVLVIFQFIQESANSTVSSRVYRETSFIPSSIMNSIYFENISGDQASEIYEDREGFIFSLEKFIEIADSICCDGVQIVNDMLSSVNFSPPDLGYDEFAKYYEITSLHVENSSSGRTDQVEFVLHGDGRAFLQSYNGQIEELVKGQVYNVDLPPGLVSRLYCVSRSYSPPLKHMTDLCGLVAIVNGTSAEIIDLTNRFLSSERYSWVDNVGFVEMVSYLMSVLFFLFLVLSAVSYTFLHLNPKMYLKWFALDNKWLIKDLRARRAEDPSQFKAITREVMNDD